MKKQMPCLFGAICVIGILCVGAVAIGLSACNTLFGDNNNSDTNYGWYDKNEFEYTLKSFAQLEEFAKVVAGTAQWKNKDGEYRPIERDDFTGKTVTLANDIDMTGKSWEGVGHAGYSRDYPFNGTFDGNHKTISGISGMTGLFIEIEQNGIVKNIVFTDVNLNYNYDGGAAAEYNKGKIQNISVDGNISGGALGGGGVVNANYGTVENCTFSGDFTTTFTLGNNDGGGIAGSNYAGGIIRNCGFTGTITGTGGIVPINRGTIENCYSTGNVTAGAGIVGQNIQGGMIRNCYSTGNTIRGGIVGTSYQNATIQNCYATGNVTGSYHVGGIAGGSGDKSVSIQNCVALNSSIKETGDASWNSPINQSGRIVAKPDDITLSNNYGRSGLSIQVNNDDGITVTSDASGQHGADVTAADYNTQAWWETTLNWDFNTIWEWDSARKLPGLRLIMQE